MAGQTWIWNWWRKSENGRRQRPVGSVKVVVGHGNVLGAPTPKMGCTLSELTFHF